MTIKLWQVTKRLISKSFWSPKVRVKWPSSNPIKSVFHNYQKLTGKKTLSPLFGSYGGGYPARMNMSYWTPPIPKENLSVNSHHRFNIDLERKIFKDAKFFTSIREPLSMFRSRMVSQDLDQSWFEFFVPNLSRTGCPIESWLYEIPGNQK